MDAVMKSGEFARLCRTTKETLRHYDRIGLLSPAVRGQNGYRFYIVAQFADFSLISALQSTGLSLSEIQTFMGQPGSDALYDVLRERIEALEGQRHELHRKQQVLEGALAQAERLRGWLDKNASAQTASGGYRWRIAHCDEEYFLETATPYADGNEERFMEALLEHLDYCESYGWSAVFQEAYRIDGACIASGRYAEGFCAEERIPARIESKRLRVKPAGVYLQWLNRIDLAPLLDDEDPAESGDFDSPDDNPMFAAYNAMLSFAAAQGWRLSGDLYDEVLSLYGGDFKDAVYTEISMLVDCGKDGA